MGVSGLLQGGGELGLVVCDLPRLTIGVGLGIG